MEQYDDMTNNELTLKEHYAVLVKMCEALEENPDNDFAIAAFTDAAYNLAKAKCYDLFPDDLLADDECCLNAAKTPKEGFTITAVNEEDNFNVVQ